MKYSFNLYYLTFQMFLMNYLPSLQMLDCRYLHSQEINQSILVFQKKTMYYNMKIKSIKRICSLLKNIISKGLQVYYSNQEKIIRKLEKTVLILKHICEEEKED